MANKGGEQPHRTAAEAERGGARDAFTTGTHRQQSLDYGFNVMPWDLNPMHVRRADLAVPVFYLFVLRKF